MGLFDLKKTREFCLAGFSFVDKKLAKLGGGGRVYLTPFLLNFYLYNMSRLTGEEELRIDLGKLVKKIQERNPRYSNFNIFKAELSRLADGKAVFPLNEYPGIDTDRMKEIQNEVLTMAGIGREAILNFLEEETKRHDESLEEIRKYREAKGV